MVRYSRTRWGAGSHPGTPRVDSKCGWRGCPDEKVATALGWEPRVFEPGEMEDGKWIHKGHRVGWIDGEDLYLDPHAAFQAAQGQARR